MYSFLLYIYQAGVFIASLFNEKVRKMWRGECAAFSVLEDRADRRDGYLWFHAASLGEFEQARPIIERIKSETPEEKILLTFFSPSGYEVRKDYQYADIVCYLPLDTPTNARRFLSLINIKAAYFIKYEFWMNYLRELRRRRVPAYSVCSIFREEQVFFKWWGAPYRHVLKSFTHFFVQNQKSINLLKSVGVTNATVVGDTRFDRVMQIQKAARVLPIVEQFTSPLKGGTRGAFVAGSSWPKDEDIFIRYFESHKDWRLIIAPHVIGREHLDEIEGKLKQHGMKAVYYTELEKSGKPFTETDPDHPSVLIINCFGLLSSIYRYADVTYVGGGFGVGIHSVTEASVWGKPVIFGPNNERFKEAQDLKACGGGIEIRSYEDFRRTMDGFIANPERMRQAGKQAGDYVASACGATDMILRMTQSLSTK